LIFPTRLSACANLSWRSKITWLWREGRILQG
jgi:hypothetical protein